MKQPHEDVRGVDRTDRLLSLADEDRSIREALRGAALHLSGAALCAHGAPRGVSMYERISHPRVGDLVVETTTAMYGYDADRILKGVGILVEKRREWWHTDEEWATVVQDWEGDPRPADTAWYVQYGPAAVDVCRWTNCSFIAIPGPDERFP